MWTLKYRSLKIPTSRHSSNFLYYQSIYQCPRNLFQNQNNKHSKPNFKQNQRALRFEHFANDNTILQHLQFQIRTIQWNLECRLRAYNEFMFWKHTMTQYSVNRSHGSVNYLVAYRSVAGVVTGTLSLDRISGFDLSAKNCTVVHVVAKFSESRTDLAHPKSNLNCEIVYSPSDFEPWKFLGSIQKELIQLNISYWAIDLTWPDLIWRWQR